MQSARVLIVDDFEPLRRQWTRALQSVGYVVRGAQSVQVAREILLKEPFDVVLLDRLLQHGMGEELLEVIESLAKVPKVAVISGYLDADKALGFVGRSAAQISKPCSVETLIRLVGRLASGSRQPSSIEQMARRYKLSEREIELVKIASTGADVKKTAKIMRCATSTIADYWQRIFKKTGRRGQRQVLALLLEPEASKN